MSTPYLGEIRVVGFTFPPVSFASCNGQLLPISEYDALFTLLGTTYGGDGQTTFALPNLNSRLGVGAQAGQRGPGLSAYLPGQQAGVEGVTLTTTQIPSHGHTIAVPLQASTSGTATSTPTNNFPAVSPINKPYAAAATAGAYLNPQALTATVGVAGSGQPHSNIQPVLALNYIICTQGIYPSQP
jgi:microcystin-dependent protein